MFAAIESTNIVGYQTKSMYNEADDTIMESYSGGPVFKQVGTIGNAYTLNDFTISGMDCTGDGIQFLDSDTTETIFTATYASKEIYGDGWAGWWDYDDLGGTRVDGEEAEEFPSATAFLGMFTSGEALEFNFKGEVERGSKELVLTTESPFFCNPNPVDITLASVTVDGMDCTGDCFQYLDVYTTETTLSVTYATADAYGENWAGWWDYDDLGGTRVDDEPLASGQALLGMISSGNEVVVTFKPVVE